MGDGKGKIRRWEVVVVVVVVEEKESEMNSKDKKAS